MTVKRFAFNLIFGIIHLDTILFDVIKVYLLFYLNVGDCLMMRCRLSQQRTTVICFRN